MTTPTPSSAPIQAGAIGTDCAERRLADSRAQIALWLAQDQTPASPPAPPVLADALRTGLPLLIGLRRSPLVGLVASALVNAWLRKGGPAPTPAPRAMPRLQQAAPAQQPAPAQRPRPSPQPPGPQPPGPARTLWRRHPSAAVALAGLGLSGLAWLWWRRASTRRPPS